jgi:L1 cell adhesion molecule like protein
MVKDVFGANFPILVQPPEIAAAGAAIQGDQLQMGSKADVLVIDVVAVSLSVELADGRLHCLVQRSTHVPLQKSERLALPIHQGEVRARFYQGEGDRPVRAQFLDEVRLESTEATVEVTCEVSASGLVDVTLRGPVSGRSTTAQLRPATALGPAKIARLIRETEQERLFRSWNRS